VRFEFEKVARYKIERASFAYDSIREAHSRQGKRLPLFDELPEETNWLGSSAGIKGCARYRGIY
jgi:hypothetical protein